MSHFKSCLFACAKSSSFEEDHIECSSVEFNLPLVAGIRDAGQFIASVMWHAHTISIVVQGLYGH